MNSSSLLGGKKVDLIAALRLECLVEEVKTCRGRKGETLYWFQRDVTLLTSQDSEGNKRERDEEPNDDPCCCIAALQP